MTDQNLTPAETADQPEAAVTEAVTRYFSFGGDHFDPQTGESLWKKYVTVIAPDSEACRTAMFAKYGRAWSMEYIPGWPGHDERIARWTEHERIDATGDDAPEPACADCGGNVRVLDGELRHVGHHGKPLLVESHDAWIGA
jgi:hypothetical protein